MSSIHIIIDSDAGQYEVKIDQKPSILMTPESGICFQFWKILRCLHRLFFYYNKMLFLFAVLKESLRNSQFHNLVGKIRKNLKLYYSDIGQSTTIVE